MEKESFQWVDVIVDGVNQYWICRHIDCLYVGPAVCWIKNGEGGWQFRCPDCTRVYAPWIKSGGRINAQKCLVINETGVKPIQPIGDEAHGIVLYPPFAVRQTIINLIRVPAEMMLTEWPNTSSEDLINTLKAATLGIIDQVKTEVQTQSFEISEARLLSLMRVQNSENIMKVKEFPAARQKFFKEWNEAHKGVDGGWSFDHLNVSEPGEPAKHRYIGFNYKYVQDEHVMTRQELTMMFALSKYCVAARMSRARL